MTYDVDEHGTLIVPDADTITALNVSGRTDIKRLPRLPAATVVYARGCTGLTALELPAATYVDAGGCTGLTALDLPAATCVNVSRCTGLRRLNVPKLPQPEPVDRLHQRVAEAVGDGENLDMSDWHCGSAHCRAGWIVTIAGEEGSVLEAASNTATAAALICIASDPERGVPDFYADHEAALTSIREWAA